MGTPQQRRRVWVVDDNSLDADRARRALGDRYEVELFDDGAPVLERLAGGAMPNVLILDWLMPGINGIDVCRFIRASDAPLSNLPVLLLTVHQRSEQVVEALEAGANDFVSKPFAEPELRARVDALLRDQLLRERAEAAEATIRHLLANSPDALLALDARGTIHFANAEAEQTFDRPAASLVGMRIGALLPELGDWKHELELHPDLKIRGAYYAPSVRRSSRGREEQWVLSLPNVTEQRQREEERLDFYSMIAHDLRSPLSAALMRLEIMLDGVHGPLAPALREDIFKVQRNVGELISTINEFLDLARSDAVGARGRRDEVTLGELIRTSVDEYQPLAGASRLMISCRTPREETIVRGDRRRIAQVLSNLIANAIKFTTPGGRIAVELEVEDSSACVSVSDTGRGIPEEALKRVFSRYARVVDKENQVGGSGLGLMIVKRTIEAHGGRVGVRSEVGRGSTFWFALPLASATRSDDDSAREEMASPAPT